MSPAQRPAARSPRFSTVGWRGALGSFSNQAALNSLDLIHPAPELMSKNADRHCLRMGKKRIMEPNAEIGLCFREHASVSLLQCNHVRWTAVHEVDDVFDRQCKAGFERLRRDSRTVRREDHVVELGQRMACG